MKINYSKTVDITNSSGAVTEPITLQEVKDYLRMEGFVSTDSSSTDLESFDFDDDLLEGMITMAREQFEQSAGLSLIPKTLKSLITNECGMIEIPFGPVSSITSLTDSNGSDLDDKLSGFLGDFPNLRSPCQCEMIMIYEAGYGNTDCPSIPESIKKDLIRLVAFFYEWENRGMKGDKGQFVSRLANKYSRKTWLV